MSTLTKVTVKRSGAQVLQHVNVQIDNISLSVIAGSGGAIPFNSFMLYALGAPDIRQGDLLIDESTLAYNSDSKTTSGKIEYRVNGNVETFDADHLETMVVRVMEKTP